MPSPLPYILASTLILLTTAFLRLIYILPAFNRRRRPPPRKRGTPTHLLIVLGSGGHTAEMLALLAPLNTAHYTHRSYVIGTGDDFSAGRAREFERGLGAGRRGEGEELVANGKGGDGGVEMSVVEKESAGYSIHTVPRARQIHQSLFTSPFSSLRCLYACLKLLRCHRHGYPDLILTNGPATSLVLILASTILRYFSFVPFIGPAGQAVPGSSGTMRVIYVESWARVKRPSLSARILVRCGLCDRVLVQWKGLQDKGWGEYKGVLVR